MHNGLKKYLGWKQVGGVVALTVFIIVLLVRIFSGSGKAADFTESVKSFIVPVQAFLIEERFSFE